MDLFITTKVEMTADILNYITDTTTTEEKCRRLEQSLRRTGQSISLHMTEQGKLELCGQWSDIVKTQDVLIKWIEYIKSRTKVKDLSEFICEQGLSSTCEVSDPESLQAAPSVSVQPGIVASSKQRKTVSDRREGRRTKISDKEVITCPQPYSRPKRNVKHKILPLLKAKRKHFDVGASSDSEDGDMDMVSVKIKQEDSGAYTTSVFDNCTTNVAKNEPSAESTTVNGEQLCNYNQERQFSEHSLGTNNKDLVVTNSEKELTSNDPQVNDRQIGLLPLAEQKQVNTEDVKGVHTKIDQRLKDIIKRDGPCYHCSECQYKTMSFTNVKLHVARVHLPKSFKCDQCSKSYALHKDLLSHKTVHTRPHPCQFCGLSFSKPYLLRQHTRSRHEGIPKKRGRKPGTKKNKMNESVPLSCKHCDYVTFTNWNLIAHLHRVHAEKIYKCVECNSAFGLMKDLNQHKRSVHMSKFECIHCKKVLKNAYSLKMHVKVIHEGVKLAAPKSYQCHLCGKVCRNKTDYTVHMNKQHLNIRPFKCGQCGMQFFAKSNLTAHQLIHSDEARFVCPECGKRFKQRQGLRVHRYIHKSADDRPFKCASCSKMFTQQGALIRHQRVHSGFRPYLCKFDPKNCNAAFNDYSILRRHLQGIHKIHDVDELRRAVQQACDESREIITGHLKASSCLEIQDKSGCREGKDILYEQKLQSRNLKYRDKRNDQIESILVKIENNGQSRSEDLQLASVQDAVGGSDVKLIRQNNSQLSLANQTQQLQDLVHEFDSQMTVVSGQESNSDMARSLVRVMYLSDDSVLKQGEPVMLQDNDGEDRMPASLEEAVSEVLSDQQISKTVSNINQKPVSEPVNTSDDTEQSIDPVDHLKTSSVLETSQTNMESILVTSAAEENSRNTTIAIQPVVNLQTLLQAQTGSNSSQMLTLQSLLGSSGQQTPQEEVLSRTNTTEVILEQVENPSSQIRVAILADVGHQLVQNIDCSDETEHIIVITNPTGDQQPDINAILSMYQQGTAVVSEDQPSSLGAGQEQAYSTRSLLSHTEAAGIIGNVIMRSQQQ